MFCSVHASTAYVHTSRRLSPIVTGLTRLTKQARTKLTREITVRVKAGADTKWLNLKTCVCVCVCVCVCACVCVCLCLCDSCIVLLSYYTVRCKRRTDVALWAEFLEMSTFESGAVLDLSRVLSVHWHMMAFCRL